MKKIVLFLMLLPLPLLLPAQGKDRAWNRLNNAKTLWTGSENAAGLAADAPQPYNIVSLSYQREDGSWRPLQTGVHTGDLRFDTEGALRIGKIQLWGHFRYDNLSDRESSFNTLLYDPFDERFLYTAADTVEGQWKKQSYEMEFKAAVPLGDHFAAGLHVNYTDRIAAGQIDPRAESYHYAVTLRPGLEWLSGKSRLGLSGLYSNTFERSTPSISNSQEIQRVYLLRGLGNYVGDQVGGSGLSTMYYRCNTWGGALQYGYEASWRLLAELSYKRHAARIRESATQPKPHGNTFQDESNLSVHALLGGETLLHRLSLTGLRRRTTGIEPTALWNTATGEWEVRSTLEQVHLLTHRAALGYDGYALLKEALSPWEGYRWHVHAEAGWESKKDTYTLPSALWRYSNLFAGCAADIRLNVRKGSILLGASLEGVLNLDGEYSYEGFRPDKAPARELYPHNLKVFAADRVKGGLSAEWAFPVASGVNLSFGASAAYLMARGGYGRLYTLAGAHLYF